MIAFHFHHQKVQTAQATIIIFFTKFNSQIFYAYCIINTARGQMKNALLHLFLLIGFGVNAQRVLVPQDLVSAIRQDSCVMLGKAQQALEVELKYNDRVFYRSTTPAPFTFYKIHHVKDSLFQHIPKVASYWKDDETLPPGNYCLAVLINGKAVVHRRQHIEYQPVDITINYQLDSFALVPDGLAKGDVIHLAIYAPLSQSPYVLDSIFGPSGRSFSYKTFKKNTPYLLKYQLVHESKVLLSDTLEQRFIPNRPLSRDSVKRMLKAKKELLKKELAAGRLDQFDSLKTPMFSKNLIQPPNGSVSFSYGTFRGQNPRFPSNDFFQAQGYGNISVLGMPLTAQAYFFDNGLAFQNRRDLKLSFDYQTLLADLENKKNALEELKLDASGIPSFGSVRSNLSDQLPDTAKYAHILRSKRDSLLQITAVEQHLTDSIETYKLKMTDSLVSDSLKQVYADYNDSIASIKDSIDILREKAEQLQGRIESVQKLKNRYEKGIPTDSLVQSNKDRLEGRAMDSVHRYIDIDRYLAHKEHLSKYEEEYRKARSLYEKFRHIRSFDIGVITPYQSPFSLSGVPLKGVSTSYNFKGQNLGFTGGKMIQSPFIVQPLFNVLGVSNGFDLLDFGSLKVSSSNFWMQKDFQSISEIKLSSAEWKGWKSEIHLANSINQNYFSDEAEQPSFINKGNSSILSRLSKSFGNGLHSIEGQYKYVPASYSTSGNPFLIKDIKAGTFRLNNSFFQRSLTSMVEVEFSRNNTLGHLTETTQRASFFSFQQLDISESLQFSALSSYLFSNASVQQGFKMHDINFLFVQDLWATKLNVSAGFMYQEFSIDESLSNQTSLIKGAISLSKTRNRLGLTFYKSVPIGKSTPLTTLTGSFKKTFFKGRLKSDLRGGFNTVAHMNPRLTYGYMLSAEIYKGVQLSVDYQGNSLLINHRDFYAPNSVGFVRISSSF